MEVATEVASKDLLEWAGKQRGKKGYTQPATINRNYKQMLEMMAKKDWSKARMGHLIALYCWCHERVYGCQPGELSNGFAYTQALLAAKRIVTKEFDDSITAAIAFVRWTWQREAYLENKRRETQEPSTFRIGWKYQFGQRLVTDYRIDKARREGFTK